MVTVWNCPGSLMTSIRVPGIVNVCWKKDSSLTRIFAPLLIESSDGVKTRPPAPCTREAAAALPLAVGVAPTLTVGVAPPLAGAELPVPAPVALLVHATVATRRALRAQWNGTARRRSIRDGRWRRTGPRR